MRRNFFGIYCLVILLISCKKTTDTSGCWQCYDNLGNALNTTCGNSEEEAAANGGTINGVQLTVTSLREWCAKTDLPVYCWKVVYANNNWRYIKENEFVVNKFLKPNGYNLAKVDCNIPCENWNTRKKFVNKITNEITYSNIATYNYCGDTLTKVYTGRLVKLEENTEVITFSEDVSRN